MQKSVGDYSIQVGRDFNGNIFIIHAVVNHSLPHHANHFIISIIVAVSLIAVALACMHITCHSCPYATLGFPQYSYFTCNRKIFSAKFLILRPDGFFHKHLTPSS